MLLINYRPYPSGPLLPKYEGNDTHAIGEGYIVEGADAKYCCSNRTDGSDSSVCPVQER